LKLFIVYLFLNVLFIIVSILLYHLFWVRKGMNHPKLNRLVFIFLCTAATCMCLTFSAKYFGFRFDLRHILLVISTLAGGPIAGGVVWTTTNIYRAILGGDGVLPALLSSTILYMFLIPMHKTFLKEALDKKIILALLASLIFSTGWIPFFILRVSEPDLYIKHILIYQLCSTFGTILTLYLMDILNSQVKLQEELINAEKFQLIGEMAASISHEIRNPLTSTRGFLQLLQSSPYSEEERKVYLDIAISGIDQANHVLTDYLTFAKPSIDKVQVLDIKQEVLNVLTLITPLANFANVIIQYNKPDEHFLIHGEKQKLHQCFLNIMKNCIEAMPKGGVLAISASQENETVQLLIEDTGIGMNQEQLKRLGSPFYSTKEKGTGLGMMVVFSVIKAMNGTIDITSKLNDGTKFTICFPLVRT
jgi:two-component system sporulation sensor kinase B